MTPDPQYALYAKTVVGLLAIVNPLGAIPIFLSLSSDRNNRERLRIARRSALAVALILLGAAWLGDSILSFFGIGVPAFRVGGGLLILLMAIAMLHARQSHTRQNREEAHAASEKEEIAVVPLAIPLMAGPGAISLMIVYSHQFNHFGEKLGLSAVVLVVALAVWVALRLAEPIGERLGITGLNIVTRLMGLILAAIGVQMIAQGLRVLFPGLA